jgi:hypothetical protein
MRNSLNCVAGTVGRAGVGLGLLILALAAGCGRSNSTTAVGPKGDEKVTVTREGDVTKVTAKGEHGEEIKAASGSDVSLPEGFPDDVPIYPKATILSSVTVGDTMTVSLRTSGSAKDVETFYKQKLKDGGWESKSSLDMPQMKMLQAAKKRRTLNVVISAESDHTIISLSVEGGK